MQISGLNHDAEKLSDAFGMTDEEYHALMDKIGDKLDEAAKENNGLTNSQVVEIIVKNCETPIQAYLACFLFGRMHERRNSMAELLGSLMGRGDA